MTPRLIGLSKRGAAARLAECVKKADGPLVLAGNAPLFPPPPAEDLLGFAFPVIGVLEGAMSGLWAEAFLACDVLFAKPPSALVFSGGDLWPALLEIRLGSAASGRLIFSRGALSFSRMEHSGWARRGGAREAMQWLEGRSAEALKLLRPLLYKEAALPVPPALALERSAFAMAWAKSDAREGAKSFLEKRAPSFSS